MAEDRQENSSSGRRFLDRRVSRRRFLEKSKDVLKTLPLLSLSKGFAGVPLFQEVQPQPQLPEIEPRILEESIENQFGVNIATGVEAFQAGGFDVNVGLVGDEEVNPQTQTEDFAFAQLKLIEEFLLLAPPTFYERVEDIPDKRLWIVKGGPSSRNSASHSPFAQVYLPDFDPSRRKPTFSNFMHEVTHTVRPEYYNWFPKREDQELISAIGSDYNTFKKRIEEALRSPFKDLYQKWLNSIQRGGSGADLIPEELERLKLYEKLAYGVSRQYPLELVPVMTEFYLNGEEFFKNSFSEFLTEEIANSLYNYSKNFIFGGQEYPNFPITETDGLEGDINLPFLQENFDTLQYLTILE